MEERPDYLDGESYYKIEPNVELLNAEGNTDNSESITINAFIMRYYLINKEKNDHEYKRTEIGADIEYSFKVPSNFKVISVTGLNNYQYNSDQTRVTGTTSGESLIIKIRSDKEINEKEEGNGILGMGKIGGIDNFIYLLFFIILLLIIIIVIISLKKRKKPIESPTPQQVQKPIDYSIQPIPQQTNQPLMQSSYLQQLAPTIQQRPIKQYTCQFCHNIFSAESFGTPIEIHCPLCKQRITIQ